MLDRTQSTMTWFVENKITLVQNSADHAEASAFKHEHQSLSQAASLVTGDIDITVIDDDAVPRDSDEKRRS